MEPARAPQISVGGGPRFQADPGLFLEITRDDQSPAAPMLQTQCLSVPVSCIVQGGSDGNVCVDIMKLVTSVYSLLHSSNNNNDRRTTVGSSQVFGSVPMLISIIDKPCLMINSSAGASLPTLLYSGDP